MYKNFYLVAFEFKLDKSKIIKCSKIPEEDIINKKVFISDYQIEYCENIIRKLNHYISNNLFLEILESLQKVKIIDSLINDPMCQFLHKRFSLSKLTIYDDLIKYFILGEFKDYFEKVFGFENPKLEYKISYSLKRISHLVFKFSMQKNICKHLEILHSNFLEVNDNVEEFFNWLISFINFYVAFQIQQIVNSLNDADNLGVQLFIKENNQSILYSEWIEKLHIND